jgi:hypothetical protein
MTSTHVPRFIVSASCVALLLLVPTLAAAQGSTFIIPFDRSGVPGTTIVEDPLNPGTFLTVDTGAFDNPCTFELVDVTGSSTISTLQTVAKNGARKVSVNVSSKGSGRGWLPDPPPSVPGTAGWTLWGLDQAAGLANFVFTGSTYSFSDSQSFTVSLGSGGLPAYFDFTDKMVLAGDRALANWVIRAIFRLKIAKDGSIQIDLLKTNSDKECKG